MNCNHLHHWIKTILERQLNMTSSSTVTPNFKPLALTVHSDFFRDYKDRVTLDHRQNTEWQRQLPKGCLICKSQTGEVIGTLSSARRQIFWGRTVQHVLHKVLIKFHLGPIEFHIPTNTRRFCKEHSTKLLGANFSIFLYIHPLLCTTAVF